MLAQQLPCPSQPDARQIGRIETYLQKRLHTTALQVTVEQQATKDLGCFSTILVDDMRIRRRYFLAPEGRFLTEDLMDLNEDPSITESTRKAELLRHLSEGLTIYGREGAPVTLTIFSDFQCPYCRRQEAILKGILDEQSLDIRVTYRFMPLPMHTWAYDGADAAVCAARQSMAAFWEVHDFLFANQNELSRADLITRVADDLKRTRLIDSQRFDACIRNHLAWKVIEEDRRFARDIQVEGTPTVFINDMRISGLANREQIRTLIHQFDILRSRPIAP